MGGSGNQEVTAALFTPVFREILKKKSNF